MTWRYVLAAVCLGAATFAAGRFTAPAGATPAAIVNTATVATAEVKRVVVYRERVTRPDGTVTVRTSRRADTRADTAVVTRAETRPVRPPDWRVGALVGGSLTAPMLPLSGPLAVGVIVERRIIGPVSLGVWGLSSGQAGVAITGEF